jgi:hypothetical protein
MTGWKFFWRQQNKQDCTGFLPDHQAFGFTYIFLPFILTGYLTASK